MRLIETITENEMIAVFLQAEIVSERFGGEIAALLGRDKVDRRIVDAPNSQNVDENAYRKKLLGDFRGYGHNRGLFENFPHDVSWHRAALTRDELARVKYIDYSYWNELSGGSRLPAEAAKTVRAGKATFGQSTHGFLNAARALRNGARFPELILVGTALSAGLIVLEGHVRLTAYFLAPEHIPDALPVIAGFSPDFARWDEYGELPGSPDSSTTFGDAPS